MRFVRGSEYPYFKATDAEWLYFEKIIEKNYPQEMIEEALLIAMMKNTTSLEYIRGILRNMEAEHEKHK